MRSFLICACLALLSATLCASVGEALVYSEDFSRTDTFDTNGTTASGAYRDWATLGTPDHDQSGYALARILAAGDGRRHLSVQDFRWGANPTSAEATTPSFSAGRHWRMELEFQWLPHPTAKHNDRIEAQIHFLNKSGEAFVQLPFMSSGLTDPVCTGPGDIPLTAGDWYRASLTKAYRDDDRFDLEIECIGYGSSQTHALGLGKRASVRALAIARPASGDTGFTALRFSAVAGGGYMGTINISRIRVASLDPAAEPRKEAGANTLSTANYTMVVQPSGAIDLYGLSSRAKKGPGVFVGGVTDYRWGSWSSVGRQPEITVREGKSLRQAAREGAIEFAEIATSVTDERIQWPEVELRFPAREGDAAPVVVRWTLTPSVAQVDIETTPREEPKPEDESAGSILFARAGTSRLIEEIKPARWLREPNGGVPVQETKGMAQVFKTDEIVWAVANDHGFRKLIDDDNRVAVQMRKALVPWQRSRMRGSVAFAFGGDASTVATQAVAVAAHDRVAFQLKGETPFYLYDDARPIVLRGAVFNLFHQPQRADVSWKAVDYDGSLIGEGSESRYLAPFEVWRPDITITPKVAGPVYLDAVARTNRGAEFQRVSLGVLPRRAFTDEADSRFGIAAYRGRVGLNGHTEARSESQLLDMMRAVGIRWLRQTEDSELAHQKGFNLWYHNNVPYNAETTAYFQDKASWLGNPAARSGYIDGNLKTTLQRHASVLEFTNEWNLHGGEKKAARAEKYAKDWLPMLKARRDAIAPGVRLGGAVVANGDIPFLKKIHDLGAWDDFELLVFHASGVPRSPDTDEVVYWSYLQTLVDIRKAMRMFGEKELWMSEFYSPTSPNTSVSNNERVAAEDIVLMVGLAVAADVRGMMYYCLDDFDRQERITTPEDIGEPMHRENYFGLLRRDWTPKASLWAYSNCAWLFEGARFLGDARLPGTTEGLVFEGRRGRFALVWDRSEGYLRHERNVQRSIHREPWEDVWTLTADLALPATSRTAGLTVIDAVGRSSEVKAASTGIATLKVGGAPVFVLGAEWDVVRGKYSKLFYPEKGDSR